MSFEVYSSLVNGIPDAPAPGYLALTQPVYYEYSIDNPYGTGGYNHCGRHTGVDFAYHSGDTFVYPAARGYWDLSKKEWDDLILVKTRRVDAWHGEFIILSHTWPGTGRVIETEYSHLAGVPSHIVPGAWIDSRQPIGRICTNQGSDYGTCGGAWYGMHLHFEVRARLLDCAATAEYTQDGDCKQRVISYSNTPTCEGLLLPECVKDRGRGYHYAEIYYDLDVAPMLGGRGEPFDLYEDCRLYCNPQAPERNGYDGRNTGVRCAFPAQYSS